MSVQYLRRKFAWVEAFSLACRRLPIHCGLRCYKSCAIAGKVRNRLPPFALVMSWFHALVRDLRKL